MIGAGGETATTTTDGSPTGDGDSGLNNMARNSGDDLGNDETATTITATAERQQRNGNSGTATPTATAGQQNGTATTGQQQHRTGASRQKRKNILRREVESGTTIICSSVVGWVGEKGEKGERRVGRNRKAPPRLP